MPFGAPLATWGPVGGAVCSELPAFVLVVESARRGDLGPADGVRLEAALETEALALDLADLECRDRMAGGPGLARSADDPGAVFLAMEARRAARAGGEVMVFGPDGSGRGDVARWVHHVRARAHGETPSMPSVERALPVPEQAPSVASRPTLAGPLTVGLAPTCPGTTLRLILLPRHPRLLAAEGWLAPSAAASGSARAIGLPGLSAARVRIPALIARSSPLGMGLADGALAVLWRADWPCGQVDLEAVLFWLGDHCPGHGDGRAVPLEVDAAGAERALVAVGLEPVKRLPSRPARTADLAAALWCTRTASGRINKSRAALWLGWDPDTVKARMGEARLKDLEGVRRWLATPGDTRAAE